jgi:hypothetical protein
MTRNGGDDMPLDKTWGVHTPPRSERPGKPVALLDHPRVAHWSVVSPARSETVRGGSVCVRPPSVVPTVTRTARGGA